MGWCVSGIIQEPENNEKYVGAPVESSGANSLHSKACNCGGLSKLSNRVSFLLLYISIFLSHFVPLIISTRNSKKNTAIWRQTYQKITNNYPLGCYRLLEKSQKDEVIFIKMCHQINHQSVTSFFFKAYPECPPKFVRFIDSQMLPGLFDINYSCRYMFSKFPHFRKFGITNNLVISFEINAM